ncbi:hypothetical protein [Ileibacterium valens]|uniref:hypothetical protein n=1 Tax=Ileibacterium valens TaxID=1862668 RepID=UPI0023558779|nr:hypothetical protein [Ileibacterium valens]
MDREVFRRHENCGCTVEYDPGDGSKRRQNVWDKSWSNDLVSEKKPVVTGARILDPDTKEAWEWAKVQYEEIRHRTTDCMKIANKYGYKVEDIERIKDYLFLSGKYYDSLEDIWRPFEPDAAIAQSWNRLSNDKSCLPHDLTLLNHELMEMKIKDENPSIDHLEAHRRTELLYNYAKESKEYYANRRKRYEKRR